MRSHRKYLRADNGMPEWQIDILASLLAFPLTLILVYWMARLIVWIGGHVINVLRALLP
jgi:hypothetical protein